MALIIEHRVSEGRFEGRTARAERLYADSGLRFTELRRRVLKVLSENDTPIGAYDILRALNDRYRPLAPITIYRALNSLTEIGLVRKLASRNAYFIGTDGSQGRIAKRGARISVVCEICDRVREADSNKAYCAIEAAAGAIGFSLSVTEVDVTGICDGCRSGADRDSSSEERA